MNYVRFSLNIALQRRVSHMPTVSSLRQDINWNTLTLAQYSGGKLSPSISLFPLITASAAESAPVGFLREKASADKGRGNDHRVIE